MKVQLLNFTPDPDLTVYLAARICYSKIGIDELKGDVKEEKIKELIRRVVASGHHSVLEHAFFYLWG